MKTPASDQVHGLYQQLIAAWNNRDARSMADLFTEDGESIGFDGSQSIGQDEIFSHLEPIFNSHPTPRFISKVKGIRFLSADIAILRAIAGMVTSGQSDIQPKLNTHHTLVAMTDGNKWRIQLFQNTPAQFHGRPELVDQMTEQLRNLLT